MLGTIFKSNLFMRWIAGNKQEIMYWNSGDYCANKQYQNSKSLAWLVQYLFINVKTTIISCNVLGKVFEIYTAFYCLYMQMAIIFPRITKQIHKGELNGKIKILYWSIITDINCCLNDVKL